jgi:hypothetical protein
VRVRRVSLFVGAPEVRGFFLHEARCKC